MHWVLTSDTCVSIVDNMRTIDAFKREAGLSYLLDLSAMLAAEKQAHLPKMNPLINIVDATEVGQRTKLKHPGTAYLAPRSASSNEIAQIR
jgi:hypothetical protein